MPADTTTRGQHNGDRESQARREAVQRFVFLCSGAATAEDWAALRRWRDECPEHEQAWQRIETLRSAVRELPAHIAAPVLRTQGLRRRAVLKTFVGVANGLAAGSAAWYALPWPRWNAAYRTAVGGQADVRLADGSVIFMNTDSAIDVRDTGGLMQVRLFAGEILVTMRPDGPVPPLSVCTDDGDVRGSAARFTVRKRRNDTQVAVYGGDALLQPLQGMSAGLPSGMQAAFDKRNIAPAAAATEDALAWRRGSLIVHDSPLNHVLSELARYRHGFVTCADAVANLRVSGSFPLADTDRALAVLTKAFPLRTTFLTRYWVRIEPA